MDEYYAAANMGVDLKPSFSYVALWMSCSKGIGTAGTVLVEFLALSHEERTHVLKNYHFLFSTLCNLGDIQVEEERRRKYKKVFLDSPVWNSLINKFIQQGIHVK
ncbi:hypothetical protein A2U01_0053130, partial [Trifolium medium]|nr:hypothetical protein [Trifolium medium]